MPFTNKAPEIKTSTVEIPAEEVAQVESGLEQQETERQLQQAKEFQEQAHIDTKLADVAAKSDTITQQQEIL